MDRAVMRNSRATGLMAVLGAALFLSPFAMQAQTKTCDQVFTVVWNDRANNTQGEFKQEIAQNLSPATSPECGYQYVKAATPSTTRRASG